MDWWWTGPCLLLCSVRPRDWGVPTEFFGSRENMRVELSVAAVATTREIGCSREQGLHLYGMSMVSNRAISRLLCFLSAFLGSLL
jgi:hypothetical protein